MNSNIELHGFQGIGQDGGVVMEKTIWPLESSASSLAEEAGPGEYGAFWAIFENNGDIRLEACFGYKFSVGEFNLAVHRSYYVDGYFVSELSTGRGFSRIGLGSPEFAVRMAKGMIETKGVDVFRSAIGGYPHILPDLDPTDNFLTIVAAQTGEI